MAITLYGRGPSSCTRRAALILVEKGVPFELVDLNTAAAEHKSLEFLTKQPFGQIPVLDDDGFLLYESRAIGRYIAEKYANHGPALIPTNLKAKALFEQAASVEVANFDNLASRAVKEVIGKKRQGLAPDQDRYNAIYADLSAKLDAYEAIRGLNGTIWAILSKQKYLAGDEITLADLFHLPIGSMLITITCDVFSKRPHVSSSRPSWQSIKESAKSTA
ncbi:thioredoxin-like protein [Pholiota conissans]|uniref:glutathione transferase n=1 Tax=Pholiota conissans TaxID=109636 RepID=A0A9P5YVH5_9AGAR|nr:thioredoxin-like protein [Pholiota conissans]